MGKAVGAVASIAIAVAAPGIGTALGFAAGSLGSSIAGAVFSFAGNAILGGLAGKPKQPNIPDPGTVVNSRSSTEPWKIVYGRARVGGNVSYDVLTSGGGSNNRFLHRVIVLAAHEIDAIEQIYFNDIPVNFNSDGFILTAPYGGSDGGAPKYARLFYNLGGADQEAIPEMVQEVPEWTAEHRGRGMAYIYVRFEYNRDAYAGGLPNITAVIRGKKVYDPRTTLTAWSANSALCVRDYIAYENYGYAATSSEIDDTAFIAAANICDESVTLKAGGTQARYECNGYIDTGVAKDGNLEGLLSSCNGVPCYVQGKWQIFAAAYNTPTLYVDDSWLAGAVSYDKGNARDIFNAVRGVYVDKDKNYTATDFTPVTNATYLAEDGGYELAQDVQYPFTTNQEAAQRIAKISLERVRQSITVQCLMNFKALQLQPMDSIYLTLSEFGFVNKVFRVAEMQINWPDGINVTLKEEAANTYDWNNGEATLIDPAPDTSLQSGLTVQPAGTPVPVESLFTSRAGAGVRVRVTVSWPESPDAFLREYSLEYKASADSAWINYGVVSASPVVIEDLETGNYDFRVKAINVLGVSSAYATRSNFEVVGLAATPADITGLGIQAIGGNAILQWAQHPDLDVREGGWIVIRHSSDTGATWNSSTSIGNAVAGMSTIAVVPLKAGTYLLKALDSTGNYSTNAATIETDGATVLTFANVATLTEHTTFTGTKTNCAVSGGTLILSGTGLWDTISDIDSVADIDGYGGIPTLPTTGTYNFSAGIDRTTPQKTKLRSVIVAASFNATDFIDSRLGDIDDWADFDGTVVGETDCYVEVRTTNDNPLGSPTWSAWTRVDAAEFEKRAYEFRAILTSNEATTNIAVSELQIIAEEI
jgi:hypothetical protein